MDKDCLFCKYDCGITQVQPYEFPCNVCENYSHFEEYKTDKQTEWISVNDRLPENAETVLAHCKDGGMFVGRYMSNGDWQIWTAMKSTRIVRRTITHWMPLPTAPKDDEQ